MITALSKHGINLIKNNYKNPTANIILNNECFLPKIRNKGKKYIHSLHPYST